MPDEWHLAGTVLVSCNCDWGCPCNFSACPTNDKCQGGRRWHIERGAVDAVTSPDQAADTRRCFTARVPHLRHEAFVVLGLRQRASA
jgi:uncharacterized protein DUF1326